MLVPTMSHKEITENITKDIDIFCESSTIDRLMMEYYMERKRYKVKKDDEYTKFYPVKSKTKNKWIIRISKDQFSDKYNTLNDGCVMMFVYYHFEHDFRVFTQTNDGNLDVINGHFFSRYRERMKLNIPESLDVVKRYFENNYAATYKYMPEKDGKINFLGLIKEGFIVGDYIIDDRWFVYKTFISKTTSGFDANEFEMDSMKKIKDELREFNKDLDNYEFNNLIKTCIALKPAKNDELLQ